MTKWPTWDDDEEILSAVMHEFVHNEVLDKTPLPSQEDMVNLFTPRRIAQYVEAKLRPEAPAGWVTLGKEMREAIADACDRVVDADTFSVIGAGWVQERARMEAVEQLEGEAVTEAELEVIDADPGDHYKEVEHDKVDHQRFSSRANHTSVHDFQVLPYPT